jgi:hypothetical protein
MWEPSMTTMTYNVALAFMRSEDGEIVRVVHYV